MSRMRKRGVSFLALVAAVVLPSCARDAPPSAGAPVSVARTTEDAGSPVPTALPAPSPPRVRLLPVPPQQDAAFDLPKPADVDPKLASAAAELFALGMADPRGLPYRAIEVPTGSVWSGVGERVQTRGFLLPKTGDARHCVLWSGVVHPCVELTGNAQPTVDDDVKELAKRDAQERAKYKQENPKGTFHRSGSIGEGYAVAAETPTWTKVVMLVRLGKFPLADTVRRAIDPIPTSAQEDFFLLAATEWLWARYDRGVTSHMAGDDGLAYESLAGLMEAWAKADATCDARGVRRQSEPNATGPASHFSFLAGTDVLLADNERRARAGVAPFDLTKTLALPPKERIAALIARLDEVNERQWGQPGGVSLGRSPIVEALVKEGEAAVEPLIDVIEKDTRLTRSVHFWRDFSRHRSVLGVHEAAYSAVAQILHVSVFTPAATGDDLSARGADGRRAVALAIRAHVAKWKGVSLEERWYRVLADDKAPPAEWAEAAMLATTTTNVTVLASSMVFTTTITSSVGPAAGFKGEVLRGHAAPSVTVLLEKRARAVTDGRQRCALSHALVTWDPGASEAAGEAVFAELVREELAGKGGRECLSTLTLDRVTAHHAHALLDYADWLERAKPESSGFGNLEAFHPMALHPKDPDVARAATRIFAKGSPWLPAVGDKKADINLVSMVKLPLSIDPLRQRVLEYLDDKTVIGTTQVREGGGLSMSFNSGASTGTSVPQDDPRVPAAGTKQTLRMADYVAWEVSTNQDALKSSPRFGVYWSEAARNQALRTMKQTIERLP